jgi:hypothetical protein
VFTNSTISSGVSRTGKRTVRELFCLKKKQKKRVQVNLVVRNNIHKLLHCRLVRRFRPPESGTSLPTEGGSDDEDDKEEDREEHTSGTVWSSSF